MNSLKSGVVFYKFFFSFSFLEIKHRVRLRADDQETPVTHSSLRYLHAMTTFYRLLLKDTQQVNIWLKLLSPFV